jgi:uncharacterized membrane protein
VPLPDESKDASQAEITAPRPRIQTLTDLIFGLALSIGAISLLSNKPSSLAVLVNSLAVFGFSFLILAMVWVRYTRIMSALPVERGRDMAANMLLLFLVSIEPYLFNLISFTPTPGLIDPQTVTAVYAIDLGSLYLIIAYFIHELTVEERKLIPTKLLRNFRLERNVTLLVVLLFISSTLPIFWSLTIFGVQTRFILWFAPFPLGFVREAIERKWSADAELSG